MMTHDEMVYWLDANASALAQRFVGAGAEVLSKKWEFPIRRPHGGDRVYGYADLAVEVRLRAEVDVEYSDGKGRWVIERRMMSRDSTLIFEAKPKIESLGELIRQLRRYECAGKCIVAALDDRHEALLKSQGFGFVLVAGGQRSML